MAAPAAVLQSEWTKIKSVRSTVWTLALAFIVTVALGAVICLVFNNTYGDMFYSQKSSVVAWSRIRSFSWPPAASQRCAIVWRNWCGCMGSSPASLQRRSSICRTPESVIRPFFPIHSASRLVVCPL